MVATCQTTAIGVTYDWTQPGNPQPAKIAQVVADAPARVRLVFF